MTLSVDADGHLVELHKSLEVNGVRYLIKPVRAGQQSVSDLTTTLATVIHVDECGSEITAEWIHRCIDGFKKTDDVFQIHFLHGILFSGIRDGYSLSPDAYTFLAGLGMKWHWLLNNDQGHRLPPGPYMILNGAFYEPLRLYADTHAAFFTAISKSWREPDASGENHNHVDVAVPSRLRHQVSSKRPLSSIRIGVKDNFDLEGTKTSLCSKAYLQTYPEKSQSAPCIQKLLDLGASIVGKTKLCAFAQWEEPTEAIEYTSPWSARADGFQSSGGSSNGSGAAIAAYDWLDITIGSDTTGSILRPALWNGCFALRPTFGILSTEGFVNCIKYLDTPGIMGRDLQQCRHFAASWYGDRLEPVVPDFSSVLWPTDYWNLIEPQQREMGGKLADEIASALRLPSKDFSLKEVWEKQPPEDAGHQSMEEYMIKATQDMWYDDYHAFDDFRDKYWAENERAPYVTPPTREAWKCGSIISRPDRDDAARKVQVFRSWFCDRFFHGSQPLFIMPIENSGPRYRDDPPDFRRPPPGVHTLLLAALAGAPELVVPISTVAYASKITQKEEHLPFVVGVMGAPGSDLKLMDSLLTFLRSAGRATAVLTGSAMFVDPETKGYRLDIQPTSRELGKPNL